MIDRKKRPLLALEWIHLRHAGTLHQSINAITVQDHLNLAQGHLHHPQLLKLPIPIIQDLIIKSLLVMAKEMGLLGPEGPGMNLHLVTTMGTPHDQRIPNLATGMAKTQITETVETKEAAGAPSLLRTLVEKHLNVPLMSA
jgi:hypothetical protein